MDRTSMMIQNSIASDDYQPNPTFRQNAAPHARMRKKVLRMENSATEDTMRLLLRSVSHGKHFARAHYEHYTMKAVERLHGGRAGIRPPVVTSVVLLCARNLLYTPPGQQSVRPQTAGQLENRDHSPRAFWFLTSDDEWFQK